MPLNVPMSAPGSGLSVADLRLAASGGAEGVVAAFLESLMSGTGAEYGALLLRDGSANALGWVAERGEGGIAVRVPVRWEEERLPWARIREAAGDGFRARPDGGVLLSLDGLGETRAFLYVHGTDAEAERSGAKRNGATTRRNWRVCTS